MNPLSDILTQKADALFPKEEIVPPIVLEVKNIETPVDLSRELTRMIHAMKQQLDAMLHILQGGKPGTIPPEEASASGERVLEGVFTGEKMIGDDGKEYPVPPNYASKSILVAGDRMKLTITKSGSFLYKQIGPVERRRAIGVLRFDPEPNQWTVSADGERYRVLTASVTFYKGKPGDEAIIFLPKNKESLWGAVENIIGK